MCERDFLWHSIPRATPTSLIINHPVPSIISLQNPTTHPIHPVLQPTSDAQNSGGGSSGPSNLSVSSPTPVNENFAMFMGMAQLLFAVPILDAEDNVIQMDPPQLSENFWMPSLVLLALKNLVGG